MVNVGGFFFCILVVINGHTSYHDGKYYETCEDCLLSEDTTLLPDGKTKGRYLFLYSKAFLCFYSNFLSIPTQTFGLQLCIFLWLLFHSTEYHSRVIGVGEVQKPSRMSQIFPRITFHEHRSDSVRLSELNKIHMFLYNQLFLFFFLCLRSVSR